LASQETTLVPLGFDFFFQKAPMFTPKNGTAKPGEAFENNVFKRVPKCQMLKLVVEMLFFNYLRKKCHKWNSNIMLIQIGTIFIFLCHC
jgi:hypothetical protein